MDGAELVIESVVEDLAVKQEVLGAGRARGYIRRGDRDRHIVDQDRRARCCPVPARALRRDALVQPARARTAGGSRRGATTESGVVERLIGWARALGKRPVHVRRDVEGFIANRIQYAVFREAFALVEAGVCDYAAVDEVIKAGLGRTLGCGRPLREPGDPRPVSMSMRLSRAGCTQCSQPTPSLLARRLPWLPPETRPARPGVGSTGPMTRTRSRRSSGAGRVCCSRSSASPASCSAGASIQLVTAHLTPAERSA